MNILVIVLVVALVAVWLISKHSSVSLKVPIIALSVLAIAAFGFIVFKKNNSHALPPDLEKIERDAGFKLGSAMKSLPSGPILVLIWSGGGFNPDVARLRGMKEALGGGYPLIMGGAFVDDMKVDADFVKLNPLTPEADLRAYLEKNKDLAAVVVLRPLRNWQALQGLQSPPFYIFATADEWEQRNPALVKAGMVGQTRSRNVKEAPRQDAFAHTEYQLMTAP